MARNEQINVQQETCLEDYLITISLGSRQLAADLSGQFVCVLCQTIETKRLRCLLYKADGSRRLSWLRVTNLNSGPCDEVQAVPKNSRCDSIGAKPTIEHIRTGSFEKPACVFPLHA